MSYELYISPDSDVFNSIIGETLSLLPTSSEVHVSYFSSANDALSAYVGVNLRELHPNIKGINFAKLTEHEASYTLRTLSKDVERSKSTGRISGKLLIVECIIF